MARGSPRPSTSTVNIPRGGSTANLTTVPLGPGRKVNLYNHVGGLGLLADLAGFYTPEFGAVFTPVVPVRVFDTRYGLGTFDGRLGPITEPAGWAFRPEPHVPDDAIGAVFNLTGIEATKSTFITAWDNRNSYGPQTSNVNLAPGQSAATLAIVPMVENPGGTRRYIYNKAGQVDVAADLAGYFWVRKEPCTAGCVYAWGQNYGYLGDGTTNWSAPTPSRIGLSDVVGVSKQLAVRVDGSVWGWGDNVSGNVTPDWYGADAVAFPIQVPRLAGVAAVAETTSLWLSTTSYALTGTGTVWSWGGNEYDARGIGPVTEYNRGPVRVQGLTGITAIAGGAASGCALRNDGTVWAWGANSWGKLGNGPESSASRVPVRITGLSGVTAIGAGEYQAFAVRDDGSVWGWGHNGRGGLGTGVDCENCASYVPERVLGVTGAVDVVAAQNSGGHALDSAGACGRGATTTRATWASRSTSRTGPSPAWSRVSPGSACWVPAGG